MKPILGPLLGPFQPLAGSGAFPDSICASFLAVGSSKMLLKDVQRLGLTHHLPAPFQGEGMELKDD